MRPKMMTLTANGLNGEYPPAVVHVEEVNDRNIGIMSVSRELLLIHIVVVESKIAHQRIATLKNVQVIISIFERHFATTFKFFIAETQSCHYKILS